MYLLIGPTCKCVSSITIIVERENKATYRWHDSNDLADMRSDNVKVTLFRSYNVFILFFIVGTTVMEVHAQCNQEIVSMFNNAFRMLFKLARN